MHAFLFFFLFLIPCIRGCLWWFSCFELRRASSFELRGLADVWRRVRTIKPQSYRLIHQAYHVRHWLPWMALKKSRWAFEKAFVSRRSWRYILEKIMCCLLSSADWTYNPEEWVTDLGILCSLHHLLLRYLSTTLTGSYLVLLSLFDICKSFDIFDIATEKPLHQRKRIISPGWQSTGAHACHTPTSPLA